MAQQHPDQENTTGTEPPATRRSQVLTWVAVGLAACLHVFAVVTIIRQPLQVQFAPPAQRSVIWPLHNDTVHRMGPAADFFAVYHAGYNLRQGYSPYRDKEVLRKTPYLFSFRYLPIVGQTLGQVASYFEPLQAWRGWVMMLELLLVLFIFVFRRRASSTWLKCLGTCLALVSSPYLLELHMGQFTFATIALVLIGVMVHAWPESGERSSPRVTGAVAAMTLTASVLLKLFPLVTAPALMRERRFWPALAIAVGVTVAVSLVFFIPNPNEWAIFVQKNFSRPTGGMHSGNYGLPYLIYLTGREAGAAWVDAVPPWLSIASFLRNAVLGVSVALVLLTRSRETVTMVCLMLMAHFVSYIHVWEHHMSGVILIGLVLLAALQRDPERDSPRWLIILLIAAVVALVLPTPFVFLDEIKNVRTDYPDTDWSFAAKALLVMSKALPTVVLYGVCVYMLGRAGLRVPGLSWFEKPVS